MTNGAILPLGSQRRLFFGSLEKKFQSNYERYKYMEKCINAERQKKAKENESKPASDADKDQQIKS
ncbi:MAG: hypothetical protein SFT81_06165 [Candidatus Caenarcaniphilales bacterium]|nr:hypothetical protein [Candidatus Caenarcaniphilales bacterium]